MAITVGIDIGGSTTKIIGINNGKILAPLMVTADDQIASLFGAFGKFIDSNNLTLADISEIAVTGVGASYAEKSIYGIPTTKMEEFVSNGYGGLYLSNLQEAIIVSMGTGTALIRAKGEESMHIGGTGMGGGTLMGLASLMLNIRDIGYLIEMAEGGDLHKVDLMVGDITRDKLPNLPENTTASNFGKISDELEKCDIALGLFNLVFQTVGMMAVFASKNTNLRDIVLIGNLSKIPFCRDIFASLEMVHDIKFIIPPYSEYGTAVGAALALKSGKGLALD